MFFEILHVMSSEFARFQYLCQTLYTENHTIYLSTFNAVQPSLLCVCVCAMNYIQNILTVMRVSRVTVHEF